MKVVCCACCISVTSLYSSVSAGLVIQRKKHLYNISNAPLGGHGQFLDLLGQVNGIRMNATEDSKCIHCPVLSSAIGLL